MSQGVEGVYYEKWFEDRAMEWRDYISVDPQVMHGVACIAGTRIPVAVVLNNLAGGASVEEILGEYPSLTRAGIAAALAYAAELAREQIVALPA